MKKNRPLTSLIVDDNKVARITLQKILQHIDGVIIEGECENALEAKSFLETRPVDMLFLDIEMPEMTGLDLLKLLPVRPLTILTTAKKGYAIEAFELNVVDYLVKPVTLQRVIAAIDKVRELITFKNSQKKNTLAAKQFFIKENKIIRKINLSEILFIEAKGDYVQFHLADKKYMVHGSLKMIEDKFPADQFIRVHRSYIIALGKIDYIEDRIVYIKGEPIPITESYKDTLITKLQLF